MNLRIAFFVPLRIAFLVLLLAASQFSQAAPLSASDKHDVVERFNKVTTAYLAKDYDTVVSLTYPPLVELAGGHDKFIELLKAVDTAGVTFVSMDFKEPEEILDAGDSEVVIIPTAIVMSVNDQRGRETSFTLAVRKKATASWTFIGGSGLRKNPEMLAQLLPGMSQTAQLPPNAMVRLDESGKPVEEKKPSAEDVAKAATNGRTFPIKVDEQTQLTSITGAGAILTYNYVTFADLDAADKVAAIAEKIRTGAKQDICASRSTTTLLAGGLTLLFNYSIGRPAVQVRIEVKPGDC